MNNNTIHVTVSLTKKKNRYYAVLYYRDINNSTHRKTIATGLTTKDNKRSLKLKLEEIRSDYENQINTIAQTEINTFTTTISANTNSSESDMQFTMFLENWLALVKPKVELTTYAGYSYIIHRVCEFFKSSHITLKKLTTLNIQQFYTHLSNNNLKATTIQRYHACIRKALDYACKIELIQKNVADYVDRPRPQKFTSSLYTLEEVSLLLQCVSTSEYRIPIILACYYGLRREEVIGLHWQDINFNNKTITICHTVVPTTVDKKRMLVKKDRTKNSSSFRTLPLISEINDLLQKELSIQKNMKKLFGNQWKNQDNYVCVRKDGSLIHPDTLTRNFKKILTTNNLKLIRFHDLRHSVASILLNDGNTDMKKIQAWLGHSSFTTTANIYTHLDKSVNEETGSIISDLLPHAQ